MNTTIRISILGALLIGLLGISCQSGTADAATKETTAAPQAKKAHPAATQAKANPAANNKQKPPKEDPFKAGGLKWLTMEEASNLKGNDGKKFLVDVYTDWCGWCKVMDKKTFTDPGLQAYLNDNFHLVKFDAEQKSPINFKGQTYEWMPAGRKGVNKLALEILGGRLSYPTLVYFDENLNKIQVSPGYKKPDQLMAELKVINNS